MSTRTTENADTVIYHVGPHNLIPSTSGFCLKLETYFRMAGIKYNFQVSTRGSSKGKIPYITHKGKEVADTNFIIPFLNGECEVDLSSHLSESDKAVALAFKRLCEENLYWVTVNQRWLLENAAFLKGMNITGMKKKLLPLFLALKVKPNVKASLNGHGIGRHSTEEINQIAEQDLRAISNFLGDKEYLMGDKVSEVDASVFGIVAQMVYASPGVQEKLIKEQLPNLVAYCDRIKQHYWPDWDECLYRETKEAEAPAKQEEGTSNVAEAATDDDNKEDDAKPNEEDKATGDAEADCAKEEKTDTADEGDAQEEQKEGATDANVEEQIEQQAAA